MPEEEEIKEEEEVEIKFIKRTLIYDVTYKAKVELIMPITEEYTSPEIAEERGVDLLESQFPGYEEDNVDIAKFFKDNLITQTTKIKERDIKFYVVDSAVDVTKDKMPEIPKEENEKEEEDTNQAVCIGEATKNG